VIADLRWVLPCTRRTTTKARGEHLSIERRVRRLEEETGQGRSCPECGHVPGQPFACESLDFDIRGIDEDIGEEEYCGTCGRQLVFVVRWNKRGRGVGSYWLDAPQ
jgi:hypothetical protein